MLNDLVKDNTEILRPLDFDLVNKWESVLPYIIENIPVTIQEIEPIDANVYIGDFYGLLTIFNIPSYLWYPILRVNGYKDPTEYTDDIKTFKLPDPNRLDSNYKKLIL